VVSGVRCDVGLPCVRVPDNRAWIRAVLTGQLADAEELDQGVTDPDNPDRYRFELARPEDPDILPLEHRILRAVSARIRWRTQLDAARQRAPGGVSAIPNQPIARTAA
jgi:hypothetical protein